MITRDNVREVLGMIPYRLLEREMQKVGDYVYLRLIVTNVHSDVILESMDYDEYEDSEAMSNGELFMSKEDFADLLREHGNDVPSF